MGAGMMTVDQICEKLAATGDVCGRQLAVQLTGVFASHPQAGAFLCGPAEYDLKQA